MSSKFRRRCLFCLVLALLGLSSSLLTNWQQTSWAVPTPPAILSVQAPEELETQGKNFYSLSQYQLALEVWQQAYEQYVQQADILGQARVLSNLALAYGQLNDWQAAEAKIKTSLALLNQNTAIDTQERVRALGQGLNNQGILLLQQGQGEAAIAVWEEAKTHYQQLGDELGLIRIAINQASAFKELGLYRRGLNSLSQIQDLLQQQPDSTIKVTGLRSYGDILRLIGEVEPSQEILTTSLEIASKLNNPQEEVKTLLILGRSYQNQDWQEALKNYQRASEICQQASECQTTDLPLQINLAQLNLFLDIAHWQEGEKLITPIQEQLLSLSPNRVNLDRKINFIRNLLQLHAQNISGVNLPPLPTIESWLAATIEQAKTINYPQAQSYSYGLWGQIKERLQDWQASQKYTQKALLIAQQLNAPEIVYLWQWQLGRIATGQGDRISAIAHYSRGVDLLKSLSRDLVAINPDLQYSFQEGVEPVYRQLVNLLLSTDEATEISQANLEGAREVIESLQLAELNNFFREACLDAQVVKIDSIDPQAGIIYPIILEDRLEVILSLPHQPLQHYSTQIKRKDLEEIIEQLRQSIVIRSRRNFYTPASQLYDFLIRPALSSLEKHQIKTLVFVPDGSFRNIPLTTLYDGQQYLLENYSVALTPGLQLLSPHPFQQNDLQVFAAGLTASRQGFSPLEYVQDELQSIKNTANSTILLNQEFTTPALAEKIQFSDYPIVHIATHGQFSSSLADTFLLTWNDRLSINQLDHILQHRNLRNQEAIELLVLSACETATGDRRAALGMAGMAVRAGARSTLATLWSVNDRATTKLMENFYQQLGETKLTKAQAIRQAQLSLLKDRRYAHPFYWAAYVLLGNWL